MVDKTREGKRGHYLKSEILASAVEQVLHNGGVHKLIPAMMRDGGEISLRAVEKYTDNNSENIRHAFISFQMHLPSEMG